MDIGMAVDRIDHLDGEIYKDLAKAGYKAIDLGLTEVHRDDFYTMPVDDMIAQAQSLKKQLSELDMYVNQVHGPWKYPPCDKTPADRESLFNKIFRSVLATYILGAKYFVIHPIMPFGADYIPREKWLENRLINKEFFRRICDMARNYNVVICLENMPFKETGISTPTEIADFVREMNDDNLKMCLDTGHLNLFPDLDLAKEVRACGDLIKVLHVHDNHGFYDEHSYPYSGTVNWKKFGKLLKEVGYEGVFSLETNLPDKKRTPKRAKREIYKLYYNVSKKIAN